MAEVIHCTGDGEGVPPWHTSVFSSLLALVVGITHINPMQIPANKQSKGLQLSLLPVGCLFTVASCHWETTLVLAGGLAREEISSQARLRRV